MPNNGIQERYAGQQMWRSTDYIHTEGTGHGTSDEKRCVKTDAQ